jgi:Xaa-Pro aminopeptidase
MLFTRNEYVERWQRVQAAMAAAGYDNVIVWQRSAGTYDRVGDVYWLTNFYTNGTGQDPASSEFGAPYTFSAVLIRKGREPELHIGLEETDIDSSRLFHGKLVSHPPNMMVTFPEYLRAEGIEGKVGVVGVDVLPGFHERVLRAHTPQIEWVDEDHLLVGPQMIKSPRELEVYRVAGELVTDGLTAAMEAMIAGEKACEAAAKAAAAIMRGGGGFHRIDIHHGPGLEKYFLSRDLYGYNTESASPGDFFTVWIYGPIFGGYWLDPGRTGVCGNRPTPAQKALVEGCASIVAGLLEAVVPGVTARELGKLGAELARKVGYFDHPQKNTPLLGHGLATSFPPFLIPFGDEEPFGLKTLDQPVQPGMVLALEAFLKHTGLSTTGFECNFIVTETGAEVLDKTPMLFW